MVDEMDGDQPTHALLRDLYTRSERVPLSFEVFPPKDSEGQRTLSGVVERLCQVAGQGFSVTMGAGGAKRDRTVKTAAEIANQTKQPVMAHLISQGLSREETLETADTLWEKGIRHILALRGDRPEDLGDSVPAGFAHASDLVSALRERHDFEIAVAAHPEKHPEAETLDQDIEYLKHKLDAGASKAYCQFVLDPAHYGQFLEACGRHGIDAPIVPGLMPLERWPRLKRFAKMNGASVPEWLNALFAKSEAVPELEPHFAAAMTIEHARRLIAYGAPELHVYTMNRWPLALALATILGHEEQAT